MLQYDPTPWFISQEGLTAVRGRRILGLKHPGDELAIQTFVGRYADSQCDDGSFEHSPLKTAGTLNCLDDLYTINANAIIAAGAAYLFSVLQSQPGYKLAHDVVPGSLTTPCDLCGFFGPYETRNEPIIMAQGAMEMNHYREFESLLGPQSPVRKAPRSSYDRAGPSSCYAWGLIPLTYIIETLSRAGYAADERLSPAINALLGVQRESGGWCRNLGGHPVCTPHAIRALGAHPDLRRSESALRALNFIKGKIKGIARYAVLQALALFDLPIARDIIREELDKLAPKQRKNGTFGTPHGIERVTAVLVAQRVL